MDLPASKVASEEGPWMRQTGCASWRRSTTNLPSGPESRGFGKLDLQTADELENAAALLEKGLTKIEVP
jgi:hypothetical protein